MEKKIEKLISNGGTSIRHSRANDAWLLHERSSLVNLVDERDIA